MPDLACYRIPLASQAFTWRGAQARWLFGLLCVVASGCRDEPVSPAVSQPVSANAKSVQTRSFRQLSAGAFHTCGVTVDNRAFCWGANFAGQLGDGTTAMRTTPTAVAGELRFRSVSAGSVHTCGVTTDDRAFCWGTNVNGQLGDGTLTDRSIPVAVAGGIQFRDVRASPRGKHTCGVTSDDVLYCWGANSAGQLGDGTLADRLTPTAVAGDLRFRQLSVGVLYACGVATDDRAYCWGWNADGELGDGTTNPSPTPTAVASELRFREVNADDRHTCGVTQNHQAYCWGANFSGEVGDGTTADARPTPGTVVGGLRFREVHGGTSHTCGVTMSHLAFCWGGNSDAQLGTGSLENRLTPTAVAGEFRFFDLSAGGDHTSALTSSGQAYCWGANFDGELGDGTTTPALTPVAVADGG
jgi:alpha-tubulin suppressor-like RCC1 family protein